MSGFLCCYVLKRISKSDSSLKTKHPNSFHLTSVLRFAVISLNKLNLQHPNKTSHTVENTFHFFFHSMPLLTLHILNTELHLHYGAMLYLLSIKTSHMMS